MWSKLSGALRPRHAPEELESSSTQGDVMSKVIEQHPNLSVFYQPSNLSASQSSPPPSPSKQKKWTFKRMSKTPFKDDESARAPSPIINKVKSSLHLGGNTDSQSSLPLDSLEQVIPPSDGTVKSLNALRRPSLDWLRRSESPSDIRSPEAAQNNQRVSPATPLEPKFGSVRSILRDPNTPGTGQNVRFFSRDAYRVISPDQSMETSSQSNPDALSSSSVAQQPSFAHLSNATFPKSSTPAAAISRNASYGKPPRPSVAEIFSPMDSFDSASEKESSKPLDMLTEIPAPDFSDMFEPSDPVDVPSKPPGLNFDLDGTFFTRGEASDRAALIGEEDNGLLGPVTITSTPYRDKGKSREADLPPVDETIFHAKEKVSRLPSPLHDRSHSFSFGQTVFHSAAAASDPQGSNNQLSEEDGNSSFQSASSNTSKSRVRALSDTMFHSLLRASSPKPPEADINDDSATDFVFQPRATPEPDPFRANATTYYTPQTMIPTTPPQIGQSHTRQTSKEENLIFSLQTQLALQTELCSQYEADLHSRDELVEVLNTRLGDLEKEDAKRRGVLRSWKKKVQELEKTCRHLEEEVEGSRHESMERSIMDEASGEALRMLHRQIAVLEKERTEWVKKEEMLREEIDTLEGLVRERSEDVMNLKETLWNRDESQRELQEGIREVKEQMEMMGNVSLGVIDEDELKKLALEKVQRTDEERERHSSIEAQWEKERAELYAKVEHVEAEKISLEGQLALLQQQLSTREDEFAVLKSELEAQWQHTEQATDKIAALEKELKAIQSERDALKVEAEDFEKKIGVMETEWNASENRKTELENEYHELWSYKEELEKDRGQLDEQLQEERSHAEDLARAIQERDDRISELDQERQFAQDSISRLEEKLRHRDQEIDSSAQRIAERDKEVEQLREEKSMLKREHSHVVEQQARTIQDLSLEAKEAKTQLETFTKQKAVSEVDAKVSKEQFNALMEEVEKLRRQIHDLHQESADKEVKIVQLTKQHAQDKEDIQGLNIALDSKQQELELIKRKQGVKGTAGSTPAQPIRTGMHRRESSIFNTPTVSRPPSAMSDHGKELSTIKKERKMSVDAFSTGSVAMPSTLGKSTRMNNAVPSSSSSTSTGRASDASMGPPAFKPRPSLGTPTPLARGASFTRASSAKAATPSGMPLLHRRVSSDQAQVKTRVSKVAALASPPSSVSELDEKENINQGTKKRSMLPVPA